jgi:hypothetical protein
LVFWYFLFCNLANTYDSSQFKHRRNYCPTLCIGIRLGLIVENQVLGGTYLFTLAVSPEFVSLNLICELKMLLVPGFRVELVLRCLFYNFTVDEQTIISRKIYWPLLSSLPRV